MIASGRDEHTRRRRRARGGPYLFILPALVIFTLFYLYPALNTLLSSLFSWGVLRPWQPFDLSTWDFVGLDNYAAVVGDPRFWNSGNHDWKFPASRAALGPVQIR